MAHVARGTVAVIRQSFHDNGYAARTVAFVGNFFIIIPVHCARGFFNAAHDVIIRHVVCLCLCDCILQFGIDFRIRAAGFYYNGDLTAKFCENFTFRRVCFFFLPLNIGPFGMS